MAKGLTIREAWPYHNRIKLIVGEAARTHGPKVVEIRRVTGGVKAIYDDGREVDHLGPMQITYESPRDIEKREMREAQRRLISLARGVVQKAIVAGGAKKDDLTLVFSEHDRKALTQGAKHPREIRIEGLPVVFDGDLSAGEVFAVPAEENDEPKPEEPKPEEPEK